MGYHRPAMVFPEKAPGLFDPVTDDPLTFLLANGYIHSSHFTSFVRDEIGPEEGLIACRVQLRWPRDLWTTIYDEVLRCVLKGADGFALKGEVLVRPLGGKYDARKEILEYMMATYLVTEADVTDTVHHTLIETGEAQGGMIAERDIFADQCDSPHALGYAFANRRIENRDSILYRHGESTRYYMDLSCVLLPNVIEQLFATA